jgi:DNA-binding transcriptional regulator LsrR (DeoR family)
MYNAIETETRDRLIGRGVRAEVCATPLDMNGQPVEEITDRAIAMDYAQLVRVPEIIAIAGGPKKTEAIRATLRGGFVTTMVTDAATARRLLA